METFIDILGIAPVPVILLGVLSISIALKERRALVSKLKEWVDEYLSDIEKEGRLDLKEDKLELMTVINDHLELKNSKRIKAVVNKLRRINKSVTLTSFVVILSLVILIAAHY